MISTSESHDPRLDFPSTRRNRDAILEVLRPLAGADGGDWLEVASGSGQHGAHMTAALPGVTWWPTDPDPDHLASIDGWRVNEKRHSLRPAARLDVTEAGWRRGAPREGWPAQFAGVLCINMIHIAPWEAAEGLVEGAARRLAPGGFLYLYGPYMRDGRHTAESNQAFDTSLRARDSRWGVRDLTDVEALGRTHGLSLEAVTEMPSNNLSLVFRGR